MVLSVYPRITASLSPVPGTAYAVCYDSVVKSNSWEQKLTCNGNVWGKPNPLKLVCRKQRAQTTKSSQNHPNCQNIAQTETRTVHIEWVIQQQRKVQIEICYETEERIPLWTKHELLGQHIGLKDTGGIRPPFDPNWVAEGSDHGMSI